MLHLNWVLNFTKTDYATDWFSKGSPLASVQHLLQKQILFPRSKTCSWIFFRNVSWLTRFARSKTHFLLLAHLRIRKTSVSATIFPCLQGQGLLLTQIKLRTNININVSFWTTAKFARTNLSITDSIIQGIKTHTKFITSKYRHDKYLSQIWQMWSSDTNLGIPSSSGAGL